MKLRRTIQRQVLDTLDNTYFTADDFVVDFNGENGRGALIEIDFAHDPSFTFMVIDNEENFYVEMKPGEIAEEDSISLQSIEDILIPESVRSISNISTVSHSSD